MRSKQSFHPVTLETVVPTMTSNLLFVPLRQTSEIDFGEQLQFVIKRDFFQSSNQFEKDCTYLRDLRNKIARFRDNSLAHGDEEALKEYYVQLQTIAIKFPNDFAVFPWYGSLGYKLSGPFEFRSLYVEQLNVLYQLGSFYSQLGIKESKFTKEGLKNSCSYFQRAAGCFQLIYNLLQSKTQGEELSFDLDTNTVQSLRYLMEAQAQEVIWQKAVADEMKGTVIAKLSKQVSDLYESAAKYGTPNTSALTLEWLNHMHLKAVHFKAAANYRMAVVSLDAFEYGEQVAYLKVAQSLASEGKKYTKYVSSFVVEDFNGLFESVKATLRSAEKDNDLVYLKPVPDFKELKPLTGVSMVKPILPSELTIPLEEQSHVYSLKFLDLLPYLLIQSAQAFRERQDAFIQEHLIEPIESLNNILRKFIGERNLPASIDSIQKPENIPDSIVQHSQDIIGHGGIDYIETSFIELDKLASKSRKILEGGVERLNIEINEDDILRERYGTHSWNRLPSKEASKELKEKFDKMEIYLRQAKEGDDFIANKYSQLKPYIELLCGGYSSLSSYIPNSQYTEFDSRINNIIVDLRSCINEVNDLIKQRKNFIASLEIKSRDNNILQKIIRDYKTHHSQGSGIFEEISESTFESTYKKHLSIFDEDSEYVDKTKDKQTALEKEIDSLNSVFERESGLNIDATQTQRQKALQTLESTYTSYIDLTSNLSEGCKFYNEFIAKANIVLRDCDEYVYERRIDGRDLENIILNQEQRIRQEQDQVVQEQEQLQPLENSSNPTSAQHFPESPSPQYPVPVKSPQARTATWDPAKGIKFS